MSEKKFTADIDIQALERKLKKIDDDFNSVARNAAQAGSVMDRIFKQTATDSINGMVLKLNELQEAYNNLSKADRATQGAGLIAEINKLSVNIEAAKNQFQILDTAAAGSIDSMIAKMTELQRQFSALSAEDRGTIGAGMQKEIQVLAKDIENAKGQFISMENVAEDSINGMITKLLELQRQYNNLSASDRGTIGEGLQRQMATLSADIEIAKKQFISLSAVSEDSIEGMTLKLMELNKQYKALSSSDRDTIGPKLAQDMALLSGEIDKANMKMRASAGTVGTFNKSFDQLGYSVQQIARELPNAAISPQLFIMAISNNLPILAENIARVRDQNAALRAENQAAVPVWKQVAGSIFSWQTGLILGITAMMMWGDKIPGLLKDLFDMKNGFSLTNSELKSLNETFIKSAGSEIGKLKTVFDELEATKEGTQEYADAKKIIIDQYGKYLEGMDSEIRSLDNVKGAYEALTKAIYENAKAKSLEKLNSDLGATLAEETTKQREAIYKQLTDRYGKNMGQTYYKAIVDALQSGKEMSYDVQKVIESFTKEQTIFSDTGDIVDVVKVNKLKDNISAFAKAQEEFNSKTKEGKQYFDVLYGSDSTNKVSSLLKTQQDLLAAAKLLPETTEAEIQAKNKKIEAIEKEIKRLQELGKEQKIVTIDDEIKKAKEKLTTAIISGDEKEIKYLAIKIALLEKEKQLREWIAYEAIAFSKGDVTQNDRDNLKNPVIIASRGKSTIDQKGVLGTDAKGRLVEITAVDKTGPTFKKVTAEYDKLNKFQKDKAKDADKHQEKLDKDGLKRKEDFYEKLIDYSRQFTGELINQLGLEKDQANELQGLSDTIFNLAKGDYLAAGFSAASTIISSILTGFKEDDETAKTLEKINYLLEQQSVILSNLSGSNYFDLAAKQYDDLGKSMDLYVQKLRKVHLGTPSGFSPQNPDWTAQQFIDAYTKGNIIPDTQSLEWIKTIIDLQKQQAELLQQTFMQGLGFDSSSIADSIIQGIDDGLRLAADGSLGGFAKSFGEQIKEALVKNIREALEMKLTEGFMTDFTSFLSVNSAGGTTLTPEELAKLESEYADAVKGSTEAMAAIQPILDKYGLNLNQSNTSLTGISSQLTEETGSLIAGIGTAIRIDVKALLNFSQNQLSLMDAQLGALNQIVKNTQPLSRLEAMEGELKSINKTLNDKL